MRLLNSASLFVSSRSLKPDFWQIYILTNKVTIILEEEICDNDTVVSEKVEILDDYSTQLAANILTEGTKLLTREILGEIEDETVLFNSEQRTQLEIVIPNEIASVGVDETIHPTEVHYETYNAEVEDKNNLQIMENTSEIQPEVISTEIVFLIENEIVPW